jgi:transcriptional regulator with XRE-family HTH domain
MDEFDRRVARQLGRRVRRRRHFLDLSQETLAYRAGIHRTQISFYESGDRMPLTATLVRLAAALEVSTDQLLAGVEWEVPGPRLGDAAEEARNPDVEPPDEADDART